MQEESLNLARCLVYAFMEIIQQRHAFSMHDFANGDCSVFSRC